MTPDTFHTEADNIWVYDQIQEREIMEETAQETQLPNMIEFGSSAVHISRHGVDKRTQRTRVP